MAAEVVVERVGNAGEGATDGFFRAVLDGLEDQIAVLNELGVIVFVNATVIDKVSEHDHPIRLIIKTNPPSVGIQRFKPLP